jgi:hypothetical protein
MVAIFLFQELSMPWKVFSEDGQFCVYKIDGNGNKTGKSKGCHPKKEKADSQVKALYANVKEASMQAQVMISLETPSLSEKLDAVISAFHRSGDPNPTDCYVKEVYDDYLLVTDGGTIYKVGYSIDESMNVTIDPPEEWKEQKLVDASSGFLFTELAAPVGKLGVFDGLAASHDVAFVSMSGEELFIEPADLGTYMANGQAVIESTRTPSGEIVGLPIDMNGHDHKGGAGWIKGFELDKTRNIVQFLVEWTEAGAELIKSNVRRFFSPSVDPINKVILGGSLTNWPATRNSMGQLLLQPIELSMHMKGMTMPTIEELMALIEDQGTRLATLESAKTVATKSTTPSTSTDLEGEGEIGLELENLIQDDEALDQLGQAANNRAKEIVRVARRKDHVVEFVSKIVGGTPDHPVGLPVSARQVTKLLLSLPEKQSLEVERLLAKVWDSALDFAEHGIQNGDTFQLRKAVPAPYVELLRSWVASGRSAKSFFEANPEAGNAEDFNLSPFITKQEA